MSQSTNITVASIITLKATDFPVQIFEGEVIEADEGGPTAEILYPVSQNHKWVRVFNRLARMSGKLGSNPNSGAYSVFIQVPVNQQIPCTWEFLDSLGQPALKITFKMSPTEREALHS